MNASIIQQIDLQIARLLKAKSYLTDNNEPWPAGRAKTTRERAMTRVAGAKRPKRKMSAEGRARIAAAQKARWAKQRRIKARKSAR